MTLEEIEGARGWRERDDATTRGPGGNAPTTMSKAELAAITNEKIAAMVSDEAHALVIAAEIGSKAEYERKYKHPEWPKGDSGVTIGFGSDLGYFDQPGMQAAWSALIVEPDYNRLERCCGLKGSRAAAALPSVKDIAVPWEKADQAYRRHEVPEYGRQVIGAFPNALELHPHCFGAMFSLVYNRGAAMAGDSRLEMRNIRDHMAARRFDKIPAEFLAMKRLWVGKFAGLLKRRDDEAKLFEKGLAAQKLAVANAAAAATTAAAATPAPSTSPSAIPAPDPQAVAAAPASAQAPATAATADAPSTPTDVPPTVDAPTRARFEWHGDGANWDDSFEDANATTRAASNWRKVRWNSKDADSPDYRHIADLPGKGQPFDFGPEDLELLIRANSFEPLRDRNKIIFGLRGCELAVAAGGSQNDKSQQIGKDKLRLVDARPDHQEFHCAIGVVDTAAKKISGFIASTVPCREAVAQMVDEGKSSNMMLTGCYRLVVGPHTGRIGCLREDEEFTVLRTPKDYVYDIRDLFDYKGQEWPQDDLHPAFGNASAKFSSWGCQTIHGNCPKGTDQFSGEYRDFRRALGLLNPGTGDYGQKYSYVLLTGLEASNASRLRAAAVGGAVFEQDLAPLQRLRQGSRGGRVKALQTVLSIPSDGVFNAKVAKAYADYQKKTLGWADGVHGPELDELLKLAVFKPAAELPTATAAATAPTAAPSVAPAQQPPPAVQPAPTPQPLPQPAPLQTAEATSTAVSAAAVPSSAASAEPAVDARTRAATSRQPGTATKTTPAAAIDRKRGRWWRVLIVVSAVLAVIGYVIYMRPELLDLVAALLLRK